MNQLSIPKKTVRSFVRRDSRATPGQNRAYTALFTQYGLNVSDGLIDLESIFPEAQKRYLEIGFGSGQSLLALAASQPEAGFIGVETYKPGVGSLLIGAEKLKLNNLRVYHHDVVEVLTEAIPLHSLDGVHIFFPDPWPKRKHHERRLIQKEFVEMLVSRIRVGGTLHLATDWEDYAKHMMKVLSSVSGLRNVAGARQFSSRSPFRPIETKFEARAIHEGRLISELQFEI